MQSAKLIIVVETSKLLFFVWWNHDNIPLEEQTKLWDDLKRSFNANFHSRNFKWSQQKAFLSQAGCKGNEVIDWKATLKSKWTLIVTHCSSESKRTDRIKGRAMRDNLEGQVWVWHKSKSSKDQLTWTSDV